MRIDKKYKCLFTDTELGIIKYIDDISNNILGKEYCDRFDTEPITPNVIKNVKEHFTSDVLNNGRDELKKKYNLSDDELNHAIKKIILLTSLILNFGG